MKVFRRVKEYGFTLAEVLVTVTIVLALSAIAVPIYNGQTAKARKAVAQQDGGAWAAEVTSMAAGITKFGTSGSITLTPITSGKGTLAVNAGTGYMPPTEASPISVTVTISSGTTFDGGSVQANGTGWCFKVSNGGESVYFDQAGYQSAAKSCTGGVISTS